MPASEGVAVLVNDNDGGRGRDRVEINNGSGEFDTGDGLLVIDD